VKKVNFEIIGGMIPFKMPLARHDLQPTVRVQTHEMIFSIGYALKVRFQEEFGKAWIKEVRFHLWRETNL